MGCMVGNLWNNGEISKIPSIGFLKLISNKIILKLIKYDIKFIIFLNLK
jgi:hypothetical protein